MSGYSKYNRDYQPDKRLISVARSTIDKVSDRQFPNKYSQFENKSSMYQNSVKPKSNTYIEETKFTQDWVTHFYIETVGTRKNEMMKKIIQTNEQYFTKAIIYIQSKHRTELISLQKVIPVRFNVAVLTDDVEKSAKQLMKQEVRILITNKEPKRLFSSGYLDIDKVNFIINDKLDIPVVMYKSRIQRISNFDQRYKGVVISLRIKNTTEYYTQQIAKFVSLLLIDENYNLKDYFAPINNYIKDSQVSEYSLEKKFSQSPQQKKTKTEKNEDSQKMNDNNDINMGKQFRQVIQKIQSSHQNILAKVLNSQQRWTKMVEIQDLMKQIPNKTVTKLQSVLNTFMERMYQNQNKTSSQSEKIAQKRSQQLAEKIDVLNQTILKQKQQQFSFKQKCERMKGEQSKYEKMKEQALKYKSEYEKIKNQYEKIKEDLSKQKRIKDELQKQKKKSSEIFENLKDKNITKQNMIDEKEKKIKELQNVVNEYEMKLSQNIKKSELKRYDVEREQIRIAQTQKNTQEKLQQKLRTEYQEKQKLLVERINKDNDKKMKDYDSLIRKMKEQYGKQIQSLQLKLSKSQSQKAQESDASYGINRRGVSQPKNNGMRNESFAMDETQEIKNFIVSLNKVIKKSCLADLNIDLANYKQKFPQLSALLDVRNNKDTFLAESSIYQKLQNSEKSFLIQAIKSITKQIRKTKTLFEGSENESFNGWLAKVSDKPNILLLMEIDNGYVVAGFSEDPFKEGQKQGGLKGDGFLLSVTNQKRYNIKLARRGSVLKNDPFYFGFGNAEFLVKSGLKFECIFETQPSFKYFETPNNLQEFIGQKQDYGKYAKVEFHQCFSKYMED